MRTFWTAIILIALITVGLFAASAYRQQKAAHAQQGAAEKEARAAAMAQDTPKAPTQSPQATPKPTPAPAPSAAEPAAPSTPAPSVAAPASPVAAAPTAPAGRAPAPPATHNPKPATIQPAEHAAAPKPQPPLIPPTLAPEKIGEYDVMGAGPIDRTEGGGLVFGDITIKGEGTRDNPYVVPWDALVRAQDTFDPANKALRIPEVIGVLHGKYVRLDGYVSFPLMSTQPKELLAMLNMWDGCCIGVPPTPYDAVEVQLKRAITDDARYAVSGTVTGKFSVKPYVVKSWLVGMYVMEEGEFTPAQDGQGT